MHPILMSLRQSHETQLVIDRDMITCSGGQRHRMVLTFTNGSSFVALFRCQQERKLANLRSVSLTYLDSPSATGVTAVACPSMFDNVTICGSSSAGLVWP